MPHMQRALRVHTHMADSDLRQRELTDALEHMTVGVIVILEQTDHLTLLAVHADYGLLRPLKLMARALDGQKVCVRKSAYCVSWAA